MEKEIEIAKSWYQLALILATLAGMLAIVSGMLWISPEKVIDSTRTITEFCKSVNNTLLGSTNETCTNALLGFQIEIYQSSSKLSFFYLMLASLLFFNSIYFWMHGYHRLIGLGRKHWRYVLGMLIFDAIASIWIYLSIF